MTLPERIAGADGARDSVAPTSGTSAIQDWSVGYVHRHPLAALATVGDQFVLAVRTIQYLFTDLVTGRFQWQEFVRQGAFMAGTAVLPTVLVALPIGVTLSISSRCWPARWAPPHWPGPPAGSRSSGRRPH